MNGLLSVLEQEPIASAFISNSPVEVLYSIYTLMTTIDDVSKYIGLRVIYRMLNEQYTVSELRTMYEVGKCTTFVDFLREYDRKYKFVDTEEWYVRRRWNAEDDSGMINVFVFEFLGNLGKYSELALEIYDTLKTPTRFHMECLADVFGGRNNVPGGRYVQCMPYNFFLSDGDYEWIAFFNGEHEKPPTCFPSIWCNLFIYMVSWRYSPTAMLKAVKTSTGAGLAHFIEYSASIIGVSLEYLNVFRYLYRMGINLQLMTNACSFVVLLENGITPAFHLYYALPVRFHDIPNSVREWCMTLLKVWCQRNEYPDTGSVAAKRMSSYFIRDENLTDEQVRRYYYEDLST